MVKEGSAGLQANGFGKGMDHVDEVLRKAAQGIAPYNLVHRFVTNDYLHSVWKCGRLVQY